MNHSNVVSCTTHVCTDSRLSSHILVSFYVHDQSYSIGRTYGFFYLSKREKFYLTSLRDGMYVIVLNESKRSTLRL